VRVPEEAFSGSLCHGFESRPGRVSRLPQPAPALLTVTVAAGLTPSPSGPRALERRGGHYCPERPLAAELPPCDPRAGGRLGSQRHGVRIAPAPKVLSYDASSGETPP